MGDSLLSLRRPGGGFFERQIASLLGVVEHALLAERLAQGPGLLQRFDPRVRLVAILSLVGCAVSVRSLPLLGGLFALATALALCSRLPLTLLARGVWLNVALFTAVLALPAIFLVPGTVLLRLPALGWEVTRQGLESAGFLCLRALVSASLAALLLTAPWPQLLKALRALGVPAVLVLLLGMCHRYIFLLLQMSLDMFAARRSRHVGRLPSAARRRMLVADAGVLLSKSLQLADEVHLAMQSRAYRGEHHVLQEFALQPRDWVLLAVLPLLLALLLRLA